MKLMHMKNHDEKSGGNSMALFWACMLDRIPKA